MKPFRHPLILLLLMLLALPSPAFANIFAEHRDFVQAQPLGTKLQVILNTPHHPHIQGLLLSFGPDSCELSLNTTQPSITIPYMDIKNVEVAPSRPESIFRIYQRVLVIAAIAISIPAAIFLAIYTVQAARGKVQPL